MISKGKKRIIITLPEELVSKIDTYVAQGYNDSRTGLIVECLKSFFEEKENKKDNASLIAILMGLQQIVRLSSSTETVDKHITELIKKIEEIST